MSETAPDTSINPCDRGYKRGLLLGVVLWLAFCAMAVGVRGVRWDETLEHAQVITRQVPYPEGHPLFRYTRGAFSLQTYGSALLFLLGAGPTLLCGLRNVLFLAATVMPIFLLTTLFTRRAIWGHMAVLLALGGIYLEFDGSYPIAVWPNLFSNGHIGGGYALLTLWALIAGHWRCGFFMLGLMPCVHVGQMPVLLGVAALHAARTWRRGHRRELARALGYAALGLAVCAAFYLGKLCLAVAPPTQGAYYADADPWPIWRGYTAWHDIHRAVPPGNGHVVLVGMLLITAMAAYWEAHRQKKGQKTGTGAIFWLFLYGAGTAAVVWGVMAIHRLMGPNIPFPFIAWMPYRLINHIPPLLLATLVGNLASVCDEHEDRVAGAGGLIVPAALVFCMLRPILAPIVGPDLFSRYVAGGEAVFFGLFGAALGALQTRLKANRTFNAGSLAAWLAALIGLALYHQFGLACVMAGWLIARVAGATQVVGLKKTGTVPSRGPAWDSLRFPLLAAVCFAACLALLGHQWRWREHMPLSAFDRRVAEHLRDQGEGQAMLLACPDEFILQARTGHPVLVETATPSLISYMPALGPVIQKIYHDIYGIRFDLPAPEHAETWEELWAARTRSQWQTLAQRYRFRYLIAPAAMALDLPTVFEQDATALYRIPEP